MKLPAIPFYPGDWFRDSGVQSLSYHDRGVWFEMILHMWDSEPRGTMSLNGVAMTDDQAARMLGLDNQTFKICLTTILTSGVASLDADTGAIICRRMVRDEKTRKVRSECGKKGGNPVLLNREDNQISEKAYPRSEDENEDVHETVPASSEGESEGKAAKWVVEKTILAFLNAEARRSYRETDNNLKLICARLSEPGVDVEGVKVMISRQVKLWKGDRMEEFLRPETLFGKEKFGGYYDNRNQPIAKNNGHAPAKDQSRDRNFGTGIDAREHGARIAALLKKSGG